MLFYFITYSTSEPDKPPNRTEFLGTTTFPIILSCLNQITRYYRNTKGDFSLPFPLIILVNSKAIKRLLVPLTLSTRFSLNALKESYFNLKHHLIAISLLRLKSRQSYNIFLILIREDLRP